MKTDRELLELAAKAAGIDVNQQIDGDACGGEYTRDWNPLTNDGDALRLAVKINIGVAIGIEVVVVRLIDGLRTVVEIKDGSDAYAATRRAIVMTAACIGEAIPG